MKVFKCDCCPFRSNHSGVLKSHKLSFHSDLKPWKCTHPGCSYKSKLKGNLQKHVRLHEFNLLLRKPFACAFKDCDYRASLKFSLNSHVEARHRPRRTRDFHCTLCPLMFYKKCDLTVHIRNHVKEKMFACNCCQFKTHDPTCLRRHRRSLYNKAQETIKCSFVGCNYSTSFRGYLNRHLKSHNPDPLVRYPVPCTYPGCEYRTTNSSELKRHIRRRHKPDRVKDICCNLCPQTFYSRHGANYHVKLAHLNEKDYKCDECNYATGSKTQLKLHRERIHYRDFAGSELNCAFCDFRGSSFKGLAIHIGKIHHGEEVKIKRINTSCKRNTKSRLDSALENYTFQKIPFVVLERIDFRLM